METPLRAFLWISLATHVAFAAMISGHARRAATTGPLERNSATPSETIDAPLLGADSSSSPAATSPLPHSLPASEGGHHEASSRGAREALPTGGEGLGGVNAGSGSEPGSAVFGAVGDR